MNYTHLTQDERYQIYILLKAGHPPIEIARLMKRHPSSISRELARNRGQRGYRPKHAQHLSEVHADKQPQCPAYLTGCLGDGSGPPA